MSVLDRFSLKGKVAWVTGGSYGIGFAVASALAEAGAVMDKPLLSVIRAVFDS